MESSFIPFRLLGVNLVEELKFEGIFFLCAFTLKLEMGGGELNFLVNDVHEGEFNEYFVFTLSPFDVGVTKSGDTYSMSWSNFLIII